jgi:hypothetical protein
MQNHCTIIGENSLFYRSFYIFCFFLRRIIERGRFTGSCRGHGGTPGRSRPSPTLTDKRRTELAEAGPLGKPLHGNESERSFFYSQGSQGERNRKCPLCSDECNNRKTACLVNKVFYLYNERRNSFSAAYEGAERGTL